MEEKLLQMVQRLKDNGEFEDIHFEVVQNIIIGEKPIEKLMMTREDEIEASEEVERIVYKVYDFCNGLGEYDNIEIELEKEVMVVGEYNKEKIIIIIGD